MKFQVAILWDATTLHDVEASDEAQAIEKAMDDAHVSLCYQCSDELEVGDPIRAAWVEDENGGCNANADPDPDVERAHDLLRRWMSKHLDLYKPGAREHDEDGAALVEETARLLGKDDPWSGQ